MVKAPLTDQEQNGPVSVVNRASSDNSFPGLHGIVLRECRDSVVHA
jgi:hypothetical protein